MDARYPAERAKFARRVYNKRAINGLDDLDGDGSTTINDAALLFDSDDADSDGDGVNNLLSVHSAVIRLPTTAKPRCHESSRRRTASKGLLS